MRDYRIIQGHALDVLRTLPDESVDCCVTSPPYWGLRAYSGEPQVWDGLDGCTHEWGEEVPGSNRGGSGTPTDKNGRGEGYGRDQERGSWCASCGAWRGELGLEPTPELYVQHLVSIFLEVQRVLTADGTCWVNIGDCFATGAGAVGGCPGGGRQGEHFKKCGPFGGYRGTHTDSPKHAMKQVPQTKNPNANIPTFQPNRMPIAGMKPKDLVMIPARFALAMQAAGWWVRQDNIWSKVNSLM